MTSFTRQAATIDTAARAVALLEGLFDDPMTEACHIAHLDEARCLIAFSHVRGVGNEVELPLAEIIRDACLHRSHGLILAHNHPSGDPTPSDSDKRTTRRLAELARMLDIHVFDHLIYGAGNWVSLRGMGYL